MQNASKANGTYRALEGRVRRALNREGQTLKKCRENSRWFNELGEYHIVKINRNIAIATHIDLGTCARDLGVLKPFEVLAE